MWNAVWTAYVGFWGKIFRTPKTKLRRFREKIATCVQRQSVQFSLNSRNICNNEGRNHLSSRRLGRRLLAGEDHAHDLNWSIALG